MSRLTRRGAPSLTASRSGAIFSAIARTAGSAGARAPGRGSKAGGGSESRRAKRVGASRALAVSSRRQAKPWASIHSAPSVSRRRPSSSCAPRQVSPASAASERSARSKRSSARRLPGAIRGHSRSRRIAVNCSSRQTST